MAVKYTKQYTNELEYVSDLAKSSPYFNFNTLNNLTTQGLGEDYLYAVAGTTNKISKTFNRYDFDKLNDDDKYGYLITHYYLDDNSDEFKTNVEYFDNKLQEIAEKEYYDSLNWFEKLVGSVGGIIGNFLNEAILGTIERTIDFGGLLFGQKNFIAQDTTGYGKVKEKINDFIRTSTYIDKNKITQIAYDVTGVIGSMVPILAGPVGVVVYATGLIGGAAEQAIQTNPDINYWTLLGYSASVGALEVGVGKFSKAFGGSAIDKLITKKAISGKGNKWISKLGIDFFSEGTEEMITEFANSVLMKVMVDNNSQLASIQDILYAGLIGGLTGAAFAGGSIATQKKLFLTNDGELIDIDVAKKLNKSGVELTRTQSLLTKNNLASFQQGVIEDPMAELRAKYQNKTLAQIQTEHSEEYNKAVTKRQKQLEELDKTTIFLTKIYSLIGDDKFKKALDLANSTIESRYETINQFNNKILSQNYKKRLIQEEWSRKNPNTSITFDENLDSIKLKLTKELKNNYDIDLYFVDFGSRDGIIQKNAATLNEKTILVDTNFANEISLNTLVDNVIKEELNHALQYDSGIITKETLTDLQEAYNMLSGKELDNVELDSAYSRKSKLVKMSEQQAKALCQSLLYDEISITRIFLTNNTTFNKIYQWLNKLKVKLEQLKNKKTNRDKVKYNIILKILRTYRKAPTKYIGNDFEAELVAKRMLLSDEEKKQLLNSYIPDGQHYVWLNENYTLHTQQRFMVEKLLKTNRKGANKYIPTLSYTSIFNPDYYTNEFVKSIVDRNPRKSFKYNLQEMLIQDYNFTINQQDRCIMEIINYFDIADTTFLKDLNDIIINHKDTNKYTNLSQIFEPEFVDKFTDNDGTNALENIQLKFIFKDNNDGNLAEYNLRDSQNNGLPTISVYINKNQTITTGRLAAIQDSLFHETTHALSDIQGLQNGTSPDYVKSCLLEINNPLLVHKLAKNMLTLDFYQQHRNDLNALIDHISYQIYRITDGEFCAESYPASTSKKGLSLTELKAGATLNRNGFRTDGKVLYGYGKFEGIILQTKQITTTKKFVKLENLKNTKNITGLADEEIEPEVITTSFNATSPLLNFLKTENIDVEHLEKYGFSQDFINLLDNNRLTTSNLWDMIINRQIASDRQDYTPPNLILKWFNSIKEQPNEYVTTMEDIDQIMSVDLFYMNYYVKWLNEHKPETNPEEPRYKQFKKWYDNYKNKLETNPNFITRYEKYSNMILKDNNRILPKVLFLKNYDYSIAKTKKLYTAMTSEYGLRKSEYTESLQQELSYDTESLLIDTIASTTIETPEEKVLHEQENDIDNKITALTELPLNQLLTELTKRTAELKGKTNKDIYTEQELKQARLKPDDPAEFTFRTLFSRYSDLFVKTYGLKTWKNEIIPVLPKTKSSYKERINNRIKKIKDLKIDTEIINEDITNYTPEMYENYLLKLDKIIEEQTITKQPETQTQQVINDIIEIASVNNNDIVNMADTFITFVNNLPLKKSEAKETGVDEYYYPVLSNEALTKATPLLIKLNNDNIKEIIQEIKKRNYQYEFVIINLITDYVQRFQYKFNIDVLNYAQSTITSAGQRGSTASRRLANLFPVSTIANDAKKNGTQLVLTDEDLAQLDERLADKDAEIERLNKEIKDLYEKIEQSKIEAEQILIANDIEEKETWLSALKTNDNIIIADMLLSDLFALNPEKAILLRDKIIKSFIRNKSTKITPEQSMSLLKKILTKAKNFRIWSMLSSPVTFFRNAIGNTGLKALNSIDSYLTNKVYKKLKSDINIKENIIFTGYDKNINNTYEYFSKNYMNLALTTIRTHTDKYGFSPEKTEEQLAIERKAEYKDANLFKKVIIKAQDYSYWGLTSGIFGDERFVIPSTIKNIARGVEGSKNYFKSLLEKKLQDLTGDIKLISQKDNKYTIELNDYNITFETTTKPTELGIDSGKINKMIITKNNELINTYSNGKWVIEPTDTINNLVNNVNFTYGGGNRYSDTIDTLKNAIESDDSITIFEALSSEEKTDLFNKAYEETAQVYMRSDTGISRWIRRFTEKHPIWGELISFTVPFARMMSNSLSIVYKHTPIELCNALIKLAKIKHNGVRDIEDTELANIAKSISQGSVGTALLVVGLILSEIGVLDIEDDDYLGPAIHIGNVRIGLNTMAPALTPIALGATINWWEKSFSESMKNTLDVLYEATLLGVVDDIMFGANSEYSFFMNISMSWSSQYIPAFIKAITKLIDPTMKDKSGGYFEKLGKTLGSYIPGISYSIPNKINPYTGEPVYRGGSDSFITRLANVFSPLNFTVVNQNDLALESIRVGATTTGFTGKFTINGKDYNISNNKTYYAKYRAEYIKKQWELIKNGKLKVTVEDDNGKRITTTYDKLTDKQKGNVLESLYSKATNATKIKYWINQGNYYYTTDKTQYLEYKKLYNKNIIYKSKWSKSKFVEKGK